MSASALALRTRAVPGWLVKVGDTPRMVVDVIMPTLFMEPIDSLAGTLT